MQDLMQPVLEAFRDAAVERAGEVVTALTVAFVGLIGVAVAAARAWLEAKAKAYQLATTAAVRIAEAQAMPVIGKVTGADKKVIADQAAKDLLDVAHVKVSPKQMAGLSDDVERAWEGEKRRSTRPPPPPDDGGDDDEVTTPDAAA